ncbi:putative Ketoreductase (KR) domain-containing protein [Seiridium unicorne]|uniref:3beta-hydroxysteroid 3-dehydrogenase n=1 Tax=Seiridium unicorne TaxID=138068 RepID=A0ABR2V8R6_9PEZI
MAVTGAKGTILVTGSNGGLGSAIVEQIASKPELSAYHGLYTVRDTTHTPALTSALTRHPAHSHDIVGFDLTKLDSVRQVAKEINARVSTNEIPPIRALILNAGFQDFDKETGRIIVVGSYSHDPKDPRCVRTSAFNAPEHKAFVSDAASFEAIAKGRWSPATEDAGFRGGFRRYGAAKLFLIMMQHELQTRLNADATLRKICLLGVDPGGMITSMTRYAPWVIRVLVAKVIYPALLYINSNNGVVRPTSRSAGDILEAAFRSGEEGQLPKDKYYDGREPLETSEESRDEAKRKLVWEETVKLAGLREGETVLSNWQ